MLSCLNSFMSSIDQVFRISECTDEAHDPTSFVFYRPSSGNHPSIDAVGSPDAVLKANVFS